MMKKGLQQSRKTPIMTPTYRLKIMPRLHTMTVKMVIMIIMNLTVMVALCSSIRL